uniref:Uncharacterized protein n=1 Tax=Cacopsylla melanoneura TaxID=428564 RepID=A0A8D8VU53_9HEMI
MGGGRGGCVKTLTSPLKSSSNTFGGALKTLTSPLKSSTMGSGIRAPSPLKSTSSNVLSGSAKSNVLTSGNAKPRSSSLSRLKPPSALSKSRFNFSHEEKENISAQYVL